MEKKNNGKLIGIIIAIVVVIIAIAIITVVCVVNKDEETEEEIIVTSVASSNTNTSNENATFDKVDRELQQKVTEYNSTFSSYEGKATYANVKDIISKAKKANETYKTNGNYVHVTILGDMIDIDTFDVKTLEADMEYQIAFDYSDDGFISDIYILDPVSIAIKEFNDKLLVYEGNITGVKLKALITEVKNTYSDKNSENEEDIQVIINGEEIDVEAYITKDIDNTSKFDVSFDYADDGYINLVTVTQIYSN